LKKPPRFVTTYYSNGKKHLGYFEVNGYKHGPYEEYNKEGQLIFKRNYNNGQLQGYEIEYYPYTGKIRSKTKYHQGKRNGKHQIQTSQGYWTLKCFYNNDALEGDYKEWFENTDILKKGCSYTSGQLHGVLREWDKEQNLLLYSTYYHGTQWGRHGILCQWYSMSKMFFR
jgi:antitoxin component YwqK of YwqJK toxin-antitoxin module